MLPLLCESLRWVQGPGQRERRTRSVVLRWVCGWSPVGVYFFHPVIPAPPRPQRMVEDGGVEVQPAALSFQADAAVLTELDHIPGGDGCRISDYSLRIEYLGDAPRLLR